MKKEILILGFFFSGLQIWSQNVGYELTFKQIFDNREYFSEYAFPQTIFGAALDASVCFELDSVNGFAAGFNYLYEHGSTILAIIPQINLYYRYRGKDLNMAFGSFSRSDRITMPNVFLNDTLNYYRPNVEGASIEYKQTWGTLSGFVDWTGRVSSERRETFLVGMNSRFNFGKIFLNPLFLMYHNARSYNPNDTIHLQDNGIFALLAAYEMKDDQSAYSLNLSAGIVSSYNRFRPADFIWGRGLLSNINFRYTVFGISGVYYFGTPIDFIYGDPFYRSGNYGRIDFFIDPFKNQNIDSKIAWNLHYIPGEGIHHSQQLLISVKF